MSGDTERDGATHGVAGEDGQRRVDGPTKDQLSNHLLAAGLRSVWRKGAGGAAVARKIRNEDTQILGSKGPRQIRHDLFVGGEAVKQNDIAPNMIVPVVEDIGDHVAAARVDPYRDLSRVRGAGKKETNYAEQYAEGGSQSGGLQHAERAKSEALQVAW
jgi:hypothetical protein